MAPVRSVTARRLVVAASASLGLVTLVVVPGQATLTPAPDTAPRSEPTTEESAHTIAAREPIEPSPYPEPPAPSFTEQAPPAPSFAPGPTPTQSASPRARAGLTRRLNEGRIPPPGTFSASGSDCASGDTVTLRWSASDGAARYRVQGPGVSTSVSGTSVTFRCPSVQSPIKAAYTIVAQGEAGQSTSTSAVVAVATPAPVTSATPTRKPNSPTTSARPAQPTRSNGLGVSPVLPSGSPSVRTSTPSSGQPTP